ncbi:Histone-lysine N-methyltransferase H3 lysine-79 specific [Fasciola hepatica]|uniref:Histone-lysine N-methyltransferase, H3 lysine-79 specific n=1 Tax=Fasciola hepatica TaxID=6192 RepID=A0A4E0QUA8_FASHE|nr:Histone-lysine N-methyltransferase H3 lysine-79 specific [Fasciola hepatica]
MAEDRLINLLSPAKAQTEVFKWIRSKKGEIWDENSEIVDIIHFIREDVKELRQNRELMEALKTVDRGSFDAVKFLCDQYNSAIRKLWDEWANSGAEPSFLNQRASKPHVQFILLQCYNRAVAEPDKLNQYPPFSPQVYGETSFELISQMIETVTISPDDSFIDLGSGVGQVVLQVAACSDAKFCVGIEKAEYPSACAASLDKEFRRWMSFYGKSYRPYVVSLQWF